MSIQGKVWVFGDNIDTDIINPGRYLFSPLEEAAEHAFEALDPEFAKKVGPGDIIVAGKNFGCGSSRETAPQIIRHLGVACVLAENFARIFFRNSIAIGLPVLPVEGISKGLLPGDEVVVSLDSGEVSVKRTGAIFKARPLHKTMQAVIQAGGIDELLKELQEGDSSE